MRNARLAKAPIEEPVINLTPLIDVVFVILIMFILIAPLLEMDSVKLAEAPIAQNDHVISVQERSPIAIHVKVDNKVLLNQREIAMSHLPEKLRELHRQYPKAKP